MSVMLLGKINYIKAAGLLAGIKVIKGEEIKPDELEIYFSFSDLYFMNFDSFYRRYAKNHKEVAEKRADLLSYYDVFMEYKSIGVELAKGKKLNTLLSELSLFRDSSIYQIEEYDDLEEKALNIYSRIFDGVEHYIHKSDNLRSWGILDVDYLMEDISA